jgi:hypothetical protein
MDTNRIVLVITLIIIIVLILNDDNILYVQKYLEEEMKKIIINKKQFPFIINNNYNVKYINNLIVVDNILDKNFFSYIRKQFINTKYESKDFIMRKASGVDFYKLHETNYNGLLELYYRSDLLDTISTFIQKPVQRVNSSDKNSASLIIYSNEGDFIDWHYDYSLYEGDRYVVLLTIINENADKNGLSQNEFKYKYNGNEYGLKMNENSIVIFKGSEIHHKATSIGKNEKRVLLSFTFCDICKEKNNFFMNIYEKVKNFALYN